LARLRDDPVLRELVEEEYRTIMEDLRVLRSEVLRAGDAGVNLPVNMKRLIWNAQTKFNCREHR
jgi:DNA-directed RNA polymerase II subunit RPB1